MNRPVGSQGHRPRPTEGFARKRPQPKSRRRLWVVGGLVVLVLGALGGSSWWALHTPYFAVDRVASGAYRFTAQADLEACLSDFLGRNILTLSKSEVTDALADLPWVLDLRVSRRLPGTLEVDFREWLPLAMIESDEGAAPLVLVQDGRLLALPEALAPAGLPVLVGLAPEVDTETGSRRFPAETASSVLDLLAAVREAGLEAVHPVDFLVARPEGYAIVLQEGHGSLLVGREDFLARLNRYMAARDHLEPGLQMDLRFRDRITCRRL